jgi:hypothetical protein
VSRAANYLSKYRYLEEEEDSVDGSNKIKRESAMNLYETPINIL